jgi:lysylphosphatidylglycerol synthetase-like protein (DUF2156 family)
MKKANLKEAEKTVNRRYWLQMILASLIFIVANAIDYTFTLYGLMYTNVREANPIIQGYMDIFGMKQGLLLYKSLMVGVIILGVIVFDRACKAKGIRFRSEYLLYAGAFLTAFAGALWLTQF